MRVEDDGQVGMVWVDPWHPGYLRYKQRGECPQFFIDDDRSVWLYQPCQDHVGGTTKRLIRFKSATGASIALRTGNMALNR